MTEFAGKVAVVTGGGSGIGRGQVMALANEGASVVVADIIKENADRVAAEVQQAGGTAVAVACDVSDRDSVKKMKAEANDALGPVSLLFATAGVTWFDRLTDMSEKNVDWVIQVNLMGTMYCMQAFLPDMIEAREGHVVATASNAGLNSGWVPFHVPYSSAKAGIIGMMLNLRIELAEFGVGSTVYCPGGVRGREGEGFHLNNQRYRPEKFGGPSEGALNLDPEWSQKNIIGFFTAEEVGPMVLEAVRHNRAIVVDHSNQRQHFLTYNVNPALEAFDIAEAWEQTLPPREEVGG